MANEYAVNHADLTSVAEAIRTKGKTNEQLVFPAGFVTAIEGIKGGGDLNFEVVGGTTRPSNPKENTIWVNTNTEITAWAFGAEEPTSPAIGMVWFPIDTSKQNTAFTAIQDEENYVMVYPSQAYQYIESSWDNADAMIYKSEEWLEIKQSVRFFTSGIGLSEGYYVSLLSTTGAGINNEWICWGTDFNYGGAFYITKLVNLNGYNTLYFDIKFVSQYTSKNKVTYGVGENPIQNLDNGGTFSSYGVIDVPNSERIVYPVPISSIETPQYIKVHALGCTGYVYNIWME